MRLKKGFTLAEILIVLMVIGVIATLTVPSMMKNVQDAQYKAALKKAYNSVTNVYSMQLIEGQRPVAGSTVNNLNFLIAMLENLSVRDIVLNGTAGAGLDAGVLPTSASSTQLQYTLNSNTKTVGYGAAATADVTEADTVNLWVTTDDGLSFKVEDATGTCSSKHAINNITTGHAAMIAAACISVRVDVNGVAKGPNVLEPQVDTLAGTTMDTLTGDQYLFYIGTDGVTAGNKNTDVAARIVADIK